MSFGYIYVSPFRWWRVMWLTGNYVGIFRNRPWVNPGRWGFYILGLEFGSRNPGDRVGLFLKRHGLWPW